MVYRFDTWDNGRILHIFQHSLLGKEHLIAQCGSKVRHLNIIFQMLKRLNRRCSTFKLTGTLWPGLAIKMNGKIDTLFITKLAAKWLKSIPNL